MILIISNQIFLSSFLTDESVLESYDAGKHQPWEEGEVPAP